MPFAAFDLHKREIEAAVFEDTGRTTCRQRFPGTREAILVFAKRHLTPLHRIAMEATFNTWAVVDLLAPVGLAGGRLARVLGAAEKVEEESFVGGAAGGDCC